MKKLRGFASPQMLTAGVILAFVSLIGVMMAPDRTPMADMRIEPQAGLVEKNNTFTIKVMVSAEVPVNVFKGELAFDHTKLAVLSIDYNTSIADLWAEKPWYENGDGSINFIGGTTREGGFLGTGALMTITFTSLSSGEAPLRIIDARILAHDGFGTDVTLRKSLDALFTVEESILMNETVAIPEPPPAQIAVIEKAKSTDLNGDGAQTITDVSIFMIGMLTNDPMLDFNGDGDVNTGDLSMLLSAK